MDKVKKYRYSEIFGNTIQGEGEYSGIPTVWLRVWGCNFNCSGFGQENPEDPSTWELPYENIDASQFKDMESLPVFSKGCDSSYSWAKKFAHLAHQDSAETICDKLVELLPGGTWQHPQSKQWHHMAFTGGEPMMSQTAVVGVMEEFRRRFNMPRYVTIESNGTQMPREGFESFFTGLFKSRPELIKSDDIKMDGGFKVYDDTELFWSVSPKLYLSGERWGDAIKPDVVAAYNKISSRGQLKYVCNGTNKNWDQVARATDLYREAGVDWPVWIMPVGADREGQETIQAKVAEAAIQRGYNVATRIHVFLFGNVIGK